MSGTLDAILKQYGLGAPQTDAPMGMADPTKALGAQSDPTPAPPGTPPVDPAIGSNPMDNLRQALAYAHQLAHAAKSSIHAGAKVAAQVPGVVGDVGAQVAQAIVPTMSPWEQGLQNNYRFNSPYAKPGPYTTQLNPQQEQAFRQWVMANHVNFDPSSKVTDYDMRGFWLSQQGKAGAGTEVNAQDGKIHYPDTYKTPYDRTFSNESKYATPDAPHWKDNRYLIDKSGKQVFDQSTQSEDDPYPASPSTASASASAPLLADLIRQHESGGNYAAINHDQPGNTASGAYQYTDPTWAGYGGYRSAALAPRAVQDQRAQADVAASLKRYGGDAFKAIAHHYLPAAANDPATWSQPYKLPNGHTVAPVADYVKATVANTPLQGQFDAYLKHYSG